jgi:nicotinamidase-related amidase
VATEQSIRGLGPDDRSALLVSEMQRGIVGSDLSDLPGLASHVADRDVVARISALAAAAREHGVPVVWCTIEPRADRVGTTPNSLLSAMVFKGALVAGTASVDLAPGLEVDERDVVVARMHGLTMFHGTELDPVLRALGVTTVVLSGVSTDVALTGAAIEAVNRGYRVVLPVDCAAGSSPEAFERRLDEFFPLLATVTDSSAVAAAWDAS